jgi:hypothetical protein
VTVGNSQVCSSQVCSSQVCNSQVFNNMLHHQYPDMVGIVVVAQVVKSAVTIITVIVVMADIIPTNVTI